MIAITYDQWLAILERTKFATAQDDATGTNFFGSDIPEDRIRFPWGLIVSDTSGAANTFDLNKVEEDDTTTTIIPNFNLASNETVIMGLEDLGAVMPSLEGGANLELNAGSDGVDASLYYFDNEV